MTVLFAGNFATDFEFNTNASEVTTAGQFDAAWVPNAVSISNYENPNVKAPALFGPVSDFWVHYEVTPGNMDVSSSATPQNNHLTLYDASGDERLRFNLFTGGVVRVRRFDGGSWVFVGDLTIGAIYATGTTRQIDVHVVTDPTNGIIELYRDRVLIGTLTGVPLNWSVANFGLNSFDNGNATRYSQIIAADESTIWWKYRATLPTINSAVNTAFTGDYTAVDEPVLNDADFITSATANQVETYRAAARDFTNYTVKTVKLSWRALRDVTGPQNIEGCLRIGGTNYFLGSEALGLGYQNFHEYLPTNPATGIAWTPGGAGDTNLEFGIRSLA